MIYPFWMTSRMRRHHYRVCVRPTRQGEFLIHPFAYKRGGVGYVVTKSIKDQWEAPFMHPTYVAIIVGILIACLLLVVVGTVTLPLLVLMIAGWRLKLKLDENRRFQALRPHMRLAPITLSRKRYDIEYASQYNEKELKRDLTNTILMITGLASASLFLGLFGFWILLGVSLLPVTGYSLYLTRLIILKKRKSISFRYSLVAGDPVFIPIPTEPSPEETKAKEPTV